MANFEATVTLNCPQEIVFDFLIRPAKVYEILHPDSGIRYVNVPELLELGSRIEFQIEGFGPVQHIVHEVVEFESPRRFVESQVTGPLGRWLHEHLVEPDAAGGILVVDRIEFEPPGGLAGFLVTADKILDSLQTGFDHRHQELKKLLEQAEG
jgi:ligand-binding SRPBCC domain-containing protein